MLFSITACPADDLGSPEISTNETDESLQEEVARLAGDPRLPDVEVTKKIRWLSWYAIDETGASTEMFKAKYGVPEPDKGDNVFEYWTVGYENRYVELAKRIQSGDSPDIFQFEDRNFPYSIYANLFQSIDGVIDIDAPEWADTREAIRLFEWGGKNYCAVAELVPSYFLWYRKSVVEEAGLEDPYALYKSGKWDWNKFLEMAESFSDPANDKYVVSGWEPDDSFLCTTGIGLITLENGQLKNNMYDVKIERAMELVAILSTRNYRYPHHELNDWSQNPGEFRSGNILFWDNGQWFYSELLKNYRDRDGWDDDEICLVPYPRDPNSDKYYQKMKQDAYMFVAGSKNQEGFVAWTQCVILTIKEPAVREAAREKRKRDDGWTDAQLDILEETVRDLFPVFDFKNGIGEDVGGMSAYELPVQMVTKYVLVHGESYTQMREENRAVIDARIVELNASVQ